MESPKMKIEESQVKRIIQESVNSSLTNGENIFTQIITKIYDSSVCTSGSLPGSSSVSSRVVTTKDVKMKTKRKGDLWEYFCKLYLEASGKYSHVYLIKDVPTSIISNVDNGIDIVCVTNEGHYVAVQCKFRYSTRKELKVDWASLSTFCGLCETKCKLWKEYIIMTNCKGVTWKNGKLSSKYKTMAITTFKNTKIDYWYKIIPESEGRKLSEERSDLGDDERSEEEWSGEIKGNENERLQMILARKKKFGGYYS